MNWRKTLAAGWLAVVAMAMAGCLLQSLYEHGGWRWLLAGVAGFGFVALTTWAAMEFLPAPTYHGPIRPR